MGFFKNFKFGNNFELFIDDLDEGNAREHFNISVENNVPVPYPCATL